MFKKLKDKIAEEVKQSPRFQEIINSAQVSDKSAKLKIENFNKIQIIIVYFAIKMTCF